MNIVSTENEDGWHEMVLVRDYLADPACGPDPLTVIGRDPVAAQILRVLCDKREHLGRDAYREALQVMPERLKAMAVRLTLAQAHLRRIDQGEEIGA